MTQKHVSLTLSTYRLYRLSDFFGGVIAARSAQATR
jgi:hypothetical protein